MIKALATALTAFSRMQVFQRVNQQNETLFGFGSTILTYKQLIFSCTQTICHQSEAVSEVPSRLFKPLYLKDIRTKPAFIFKSHVVPL